MDQEQVNTFINQYVSMWHEVDPARRRELVSALFAEDAEDYTHKLAVRGTDQIVARVARAHEDWVASRGFVFRPAGSTDAHHHVIKFLWEMLPKAGGPIEARGLDVFVLREDGRIRALYQFNEPIA
jgi:hypothetical protein